MTVKDQDLRQAEERHAAHERELRERLADQAGAFAQTQSHVLALEKRMLAEVDQESAKQWPWRTALRRHP